MSICSQVRSLLCIYTNSLYVCTHIYIYIHMSTFRSAIWFDHLLQKKMCDMCVCICACMSVGLLYVYAYKIAVHECMPTSLHECMPTSCATCMFVSKFVFMCCSSSRAATCPMQHVRCNMSLMHIPCRHLNVCKLHVRLSWYLHWCAVMCLFDKCLPSITCVYLICM